MQRTLYLFIYCFYQETIERGSNIVYTQKRKQDIQETVVRCLPQENCVSLTGSQLGTLASQELALQTGTRLAYLNITIGSIPLKS